MALRDDLADRVKARVGSTLNGKWRLDAVLGVGGMAAVYAATHRNQKRAAIKMLHPEVSLDKQVTLRFTREGYLANTVGHPGTVSVLDDDVTPDGAAFLVMERLEGETLEARWTRHGAHLPASEVLGIADQLLDVLAAAHAKGILHRDLKPENLFLTHDGQLKVLDFGIARLRELAAGQTAGSTRSGSLLGTPAFMAPEQARGRSQDVDERSDLWAVGATMYTLLSGKFVHEAETINEQLIQTATKRAASIAKLMPALPRPVVAIVDRALAYERDQRWQNAREFQRAVREAMPMVAAGPPTVRGHGSMPRIAEATLLAPSSAASGIDERQGTLTTGRPFISELRAPSKPAWPRRSVAWGAPLFALLGGLALYAWRASHAPVAQTPSIELSAGGVGPAASARPERPSATEDRPAEGDTSEAKAIASVEPKPSVDPKTHDRPGKAPKSGAHLAGATARPGPTSETHPPTLPPTASPSPTATTRLDMYERRY